MIRFPDDISKLPTRPGVYIFHDPDGNILYVGKSKSLRNRVRSYLKSELVEERKRPMLERIATMEFLETENEIGALTLEADLIKSHRPPYNVMLMDDRGYSYIHFSKDDFPSVKRVYRRNEDGEYMGPYLDTNGAGMAVRLIREIWGIRDCHNFRKGGCVNRHIGICVGPCQGEVTIEEYQKCIDEAKRFLRGDWKKVRDSLRRKMKTSSENEQYEEAARLRDVLAGMERFLSRRTFLGTSPDDEDVIAMSEDGGRTIVSILVVREGRVMHSGRVVLEGGGSSRLEEFLSVYYTDVPVPPNVVLDHVPDDVEVITKWLSRRRGKTVTLHCPLRGRRKKLIGLAKRNARLYMQMDDDVDRVEALYKALHLPRRPVRIESYDISHLGGEYVAASMAVFVDGVPDKKKYRWYKVRTDEQGDDARLGEILSRRGKRIGEKGWERPDLVLIDGGKVQLESVMRAMEGTGIPVISLAKRDEEIFLPGIAQSVKLPPDSPGMLLLRSARDESHRFANVFRRRLQADRMSRSVLDSIPGVGPTIRMRLLKRFGSVRRITDADIEDIQAVKGVGPELARIIKTTLSDQNSMSS